jgi:hypothetical protein
MEKPGRGVGQALAPLLTLERAPRRISGLGAAGLQG